MENITAIIIDKENAEFESQYRGITLDEGGQVTIGIIEYESALEKINEQRRALEKERSDLKVSLNKKSNELYDQRTTRLEEERNQISEDRDSKWTVKEGYYDSSTGKKKYYTHAHVSYLTNYKKVKQDYDKGVASINDMISALNTDEEKLNEDFSKIVWAYRIIHKRGSTSLKANKAIGEGGKRIQVTAKDFLQGGGMVWVQPFFKGEKESLRNEKAGFYIKMISTTKKVLGFEWAGIDAQGNAVKINQPVQTGSSVQLHIYTQGLYGQTVKINLKANGKLLKANDYAEGIVIYSNGKPLDTELLKSSSGEDFYAEVDVYDLSDPKSLKPSTEYIGGYLIRDEADETEGEEKKSTSTKSILNAQKAVLELRVDPDWSKIDGSKNSEETISIVCEVFAAGEKFRFTQPLKVEYQKIPNKDMPAVSNQAVYVDNIETNFEEFHHCGYDRFIIKTDDREVDLLENKTVKPVQRFEIVAGPKKNAQKITVQTNTKTDECSIENPDNKHKGRAIQLIHHPEEFFAKKGDSKESSVTAQFEIKVGGEKSSLSHKQQLFRGKPELEVQTSNDEELTFNARYLYDYSVLNGFWDIPLPIHPIFRYFWLSDKRVAELAQRNKQIYEIQTATCRRSQPLFIEVHPDVAWSLRLSFNNTKIQKEYASNQTYKDTKQAKFKRDEPSWIKVGEDRYLGISLGATWDEDMEFKAADDVKELLKRFKTLMSKFTDIGDYVKNELLGNENLNKDKADKDALEVNETLKAQQKEREKLAHEKIKEDKELNELSRNFKGAQKKLDDAKDDKSKKDAFNKMQTLQRKMDKRSKKHKFKLTRSVFELELQKPNLELQFNWSRENIKTQTAYMNQTALVFQGALVSAPIFGIKATLDFLALVQRAHPVALAVIAIADIGMKLLGKENKITCELSAEGTFGGKVQGFLNSKTGENSFNKKDLIERGEEVAEITSSIEFKLKIAIKIKMEKKVSFIIVTLSGTLEVEAEIGATAKWIGSAPFGVDDTGWYLEPSLMFEGLEVKGAVSLKAEVTANEKNKKIKNRENSSNKPTNAALKTKGDIQWQAIPASEKPKSWGKIYLSKNS